MSVIRSFIAIELPEPVRRGLAQTRDDLRGRLPNVPVRWVQPESIHLTLKFLGDVSLAAIERLSERLKVEAARHAPFEVDIGGLGAFPNTRRARVIWVGVTAPPTLLALQHGIESEMERLGYAPEARPFSPHLTLGRVADSAGSTGLHSISQALESISAGSLGVAHVTSVHLFRSDLRPGGSVYTRLFSATLGLER